jgi:hypothetical protein
MFATKLKTILTVYVSAGTEATEMIPFVMLSSSAVAQVPRCLLLMISWHAFGAYTQFMCKECKYTHGYCQQGYRASLFATQICDLVVVQCNCTLMYCHCRILP